MPRPLYPQGKITRKTLDSVYEIKSKVSKCDYIDEQMDRWDMVVHLFYVLHKNPKKKRKVIYFLVH
jgi:hypothetical protein